MNVCRHLHFLRYAETFLDYLWQFILIISFEDDIYSFVFYYSIRQHFVIAGRSAYPSSIFSFQFDGFMS